MPILTPEEFAKLTGQQAAPAPQQQQESGTVMSQDQFLAQFGDGEQLPSYANGVSPETPLNVSPVSLEERAKLSVGNEAGKMKYLRQAYGDVKKTREGDIIVLDKATNLWHRVDPTGLGDGNAWNMTKELVADAVDYLPEVTKVGVQVGATALATTGGLLAAAPTGGTSLAAAAAFSGAVGAALSAGETSLGRLVGTYDATPEEEIRDIAIEALMNVGGTFIAAGVRPAARAISEGVKKGAKALGTSTSNVAKSAIASMTGAGERNLDILINNADDVANIQAKYLSRAGDSSKAVEQMVLDNVNNVEQIAKSVRPAATKFYGKLSQEVFENAPDNFAPGFNEIQKKANAALGGLGIGEVQQNGMFKVFSKEELAKLAETGKISDFLFDDDSLKIVNEAVANLNKLSLVKEASGKAGAKQLLDFRRGFFDLTMKLREQADDAALAPAQRVLASIKEVVENSVTRRFDLPAEVKSKTLGFASTNLYADMNRAYNIAMNELAPMTRAVAQANKGNPQAFQTLYNQLNTKAGKNTIQKSSFEQAVEFIGKHGGEDGANIANLYKTIGLTESAAAFTPLIKQSLVSQGASIGMAGSLFSGNLAGIATSSAAAGMTSPRMAKNVVQGALKTKAFLSQLNPQQLKQLTGNPQLMDKWAENFISHPLIVEERKQNLIDQAQRAMTGR